jgi:hypothetical protein
MRKATTKILAAGLALLWVFSALPAEAQSSRDRNAPKQIGPTTPSERGKKGQSEQQEERQLQRNAWLQGDERQQEQLVGCYRLSAILAYHSREVRKMLVAGEVNWKDVTGQYEELKRGIQLLTEKHEQFAMELNNGQRSWWERQLREIMAIQLQLQDRTEAIGRELNGEKPGSVQMAKAFTELDGQFRKWGQFYGQIGADMNIPDLEQRVAPGKIRGLPGAQNPGR